MSPSNSDVAEFLVHLPTEATTRDLGAALAGAAEPGTIVLLDGPLGAGKTTLVQGFARAVGAARAGSPSFVLAHHYPGGRMPVWHLDLYRIESAAEIDDLDLDQYLPEDGVALVEWAGRAAGRWPKDRLEVEMSIEGTGRAARVRGRGRCAASARRVARTLAPA
jgi:tRNA threonylcarbamoyladenosine biosynthesis protein TsaE